MKHEEHGVPDPKTGIQISAENSIELENAVIAHQKFIEYSQKLLNVNHWHEMAGSAGAVFQLVDGQGKEVDRLATQGDYFKIDIPGPGPSAGHGYDWVKIEEISKKGDENSESLAMRVRPATDPQAPSENIAHFFSEEATSTFKMMREKNRIKASIHDRNTKPNTENAPITDKIRNTAVATGAIAFFSKVQWQKLVNGLLGIKE